MMLENEKLLLPGTLPPSTTAWLKVNMMQIPHRLERTNAPRIILASPCHQPWYSE